MLLSIVVPAYNEESYLSDCLSYVQAEVGRYTENGLIEVLVVDNASTDRTAEVAGSFAGVRVVREPQKGLTRARQKGLMEASGDILAFIDADTRMPEGWIGRLLESFSQNSRVVCVSGPYIYYDSRRLERILIRLYWIFLAVPSYWITRYMAVGGNFAAKREALLRIDGFDTNIAFYGEDTNIARRLAAVGKVWFRMSMPMYTSPRRLHTEGLFRTALKYAAHFLYEVILKRPTTGSYRDVR